MSKQQGYQEFSTDAPDGVDYGFSSRLPQAGGSYQTDRVSPMAHPAPAYAGAPVTGYPVAAPSMAGGMAGPAGMGAEDPLGRRDTKRARRQGGRQGKRGENGGGRRKPKIAKLLFGGPVGLVVGLARRAIRMGKAQLGKKSPAPGGHPKS